MAERDDPDIILRRDYSHLWTLPPPLPPRPLPWIHLIVVASVMLGAVLFAVSD